IGTGGGNWRISHPTIDIEIISLFQLYAPVPTNRRTHRTRIPAAGTLPGRRREGPPGIFRPRNIPAQWSGAVIASLQPRLFDHPPPKIFWNQKPSLVWGVYS